MLFSFLTYLTPVSYFQRKNNSGSTSFPIYDQLPESVKDCLKADDRYNSSLAQHYDLSWQAIKKGYIGDVSCYKDIDTLSVRDNYHFIRKNFHKAWVFYVLVLRISCFNDPIKEIRAWWATKGIVREPDSIEPINYTSLKNYNSSLISRTPLVSVIIPTLNRYQYLKDILEDLEKQSYSNFEVVIVDQSDNFKSNFYTNFNLDITLIRQKEKALWLARNTAIKEAKGTLVALSEDDVRIESDWIFNHIKCLDFFNAQVSAGVFYPLGEQIPKERSFFSLAAQFATGNAMLYKTIFERFGLFDRQFEKQRMGDGEFGMRIHLEGVLSVSNPHASCIDVKAGTGGLREMGNWDAFRPGSFFSPRPIPSVTYFYRRYFGNKSARLALLRNVPISLFSYKSKKNRVVLLLSLFLAILLLPIIFYQVWKSWRLASIKLQEGPQIEILE